jgi:hypothetical protein
VRLLQRLGGSIRARLVLGAALGGLYIVRRRRGA